MRNVVDEFLKFKHSFLYHFASLTWLLSAKAKFDLHKAFEALVRERSQNIARLVEEKSFIKVDKVRIPSLNLIVPKSAWLRNIKNKDLGLHFHEGRSPVHRNLH